MVGPPSATAAVDESAEALELVLFSVVSVARSGGAKRAEERSDELV